MGSGLDPESIVISGPRARGLSHRLTSAAPWQNRPRSSSGQGSLMSFWSWLKKACTPHAFLRDPPDQDDDIVAGAMIGGVVGGASKGLAVGVASSVREQDQSGLSEDRPSASQSAQSSIWQEKKRRNHQPGQRCYNKPDNPRSRHGAIRKLFGRIVRDDCG